MDLVPTAAEALGSVGQRLPQPEVAALAGRLGALLAADDETPDVRREAALSLARLASDGEGVIAALRTAMWDTNGHVKGYAVKALDRIGTPEALRAVLDHLQTLRYA